MGNCCTSCATSDIQVYDYGYHEASLHIKTDINGSHKIGSIHSREGARGLNQDSAVLYQGYGTEDGAFCAVFDGHGKNGHIVSRVARNQLPSLILNQTKLMEWNDAFGTCFNAMDKEIKLLDSVDCSISGSTAVVIVKQGEDLVIANLGDSRAVMGTINENKIQAIQLTVDMKPNVPGEKESIEKANGRVFAHESQPHIERVWLPNDDVPGLAMTRALGDFDLKRYGVIASPDVTYQRLTSNDLFLVLASDGVWDVLSNEEVVSVVESVTNREAAAEAVVDAAIAAWRCKFPSAVIDDCTVVCLFFNETNEIDISPLES